MDEQNTTSITRYSRVLAIDPGASYLGFAFAMGGQIIRCGYLPDIKDASFLKVLNTQICILEKPVQYPGSKAPRADISDLSLATGRIEALVGAPRTLFWAPYEWKGQTPKAIHQARILSRLSPEEQSQLPDAKGHRGHVIDACGMVLKYLRRL
jgi:hypothetical protein